MGIGASAGGLEAFTAVLSNVSPSTGMAFVIIQHLSPDRESLLVQLLAKSTSMPVVEAKEGMRLRPNRVHVIPPDVRMAIAKGALSLRPRVHGHGAPMPIDHFFRSLAENQNNLAIGVVLSGNESDGALGLGAIRDDGGIALVQSETSAKNPGMPRAAIASGYADLVLSAEDIGRELERIAARLTAPGSVPDDAAASNILFNELRRQHGVDFAQYKSANVARCVNRRMVLRRIDSLSAYAEYTVQNPAESAALFEELLINVSGFMRDPDVFAAFEANLIPKLLSESDGHSPLRVWVPGCATGEEVYSIGMILLDAASAHSTPFDFNLFATDLNEVSIAKARTGAYTAAQIAQLAPERRDRFFTRVDGRYQVVKQLREMCVFARHNLAGDPPFSRMDLISCRNVLSYLGEKLQQRIIGAFHYALRPGGYLVLGRSEGIGNSTGMFSALDNRSRFYRKVPSKESGRSLSIPAPPLQQGERQGRTSPSSPPGRIAEQIAASEYGPAWVLVDEDYRLLQSAGDTVAFLRMPSGKATFDILRLARPHIRNALRGLLAAAATSEGTVHSPPIRQKESARAVQIDVRPIAGSEGKGQCYLIVFLPTERIPLRAEAAAPGRGEIQELIDENQRLRLELDVTANRLQATINQRDAAIEELTSANEEIRSSNEELQSINEEIETSKEEIEATNEEFIVLNNELASRNRDLSRLSDDLNNILMSAAVPILMVDDRLSIRRSTPAAEDLLNIRSSDAGRPMRDICMHLSIDDLRPLVRRVIDTLEAEEVEVQDREGRWRVLHVRPYRTSDNRIEGAVLHLIDIDELRKLQLKTEHARRFAESVIESARTPLAVLDHEWRIRLANPAFVQSFGGPNSDVVGQPFFSQPRAKWNLPSIKAALEQVARGGEVLDDFEFQDRTPDSVPRVLSLTARRVQPDGGTEVLIAIEDITDRKRSEHHLMSERAKLQQTVSRSAKALQSTAQGLREATAVRRQAETALEESESALRRNREELRALTARLIHAQDEERRRVSRELHDDLSQKVARLQFDIERLQDRTGRRLTDSPARLDSLREQAGALAEDVRRIAHRLHPSALDHLGLAIALRSYCGDFATRERLPVRFRAVNAPKNLPSGIANSLFRIVQEALRNVAKHAGKAASATITLSGGKTELGLRIRDTGVGFAPESVRGMGGLGLVSMEERVRLLNGDFQLESRPGAGVIIEIHVPLRPAGSVV